MGATREDVQRRLEGARTGRQERLGQRRQELKERLGEFQQVMDPQAPMQLDLEEPVERRRSLFADVLEGSRPAVLTAGALLGGTGGAAAGPVGVAVGGALGTAAGEYAHQLMVDVARAAGVEGLEDPGTPLERTDTAVKEATIDLGFTAGARSLSSVVRLGRKGLARALGVGPEAQQRAAEMQQAGIRPGIIDVSESKGPEMFNRVMGRFPFLGGRFFREGAERKAHDITEAADRLFLRVGPSMNMADLGIRLDRAADTRFRWFRRHINRQYEGALRAARESDARVPTSGIKQKAEQIREAAIDRFGARANRHPVVKFLRTEVDSLPENASVDRYDGFLQRLDESMEVAKREGFRVHQLGELKQTAERAIHEMPNQEVAQRFREADATFARIMSEVFETPTAQKLERQIRKGRFHVGLERAGTRNPDETFRIAFNADSPEALRDLRQLVGPERFRRAARANLDDAWENAMKRGQAAAESGDPGASVRGGFDLNAWRRSLGLHNKRSSRFAATREALEGTPVTIEDLEQFTDSMERALKIVPADTNMFIARRATLGGMRSAIRAFLPVAGAGSAGGAVAGGPGAVASVGVLLTSRYFSKLLNDPRRLRLAQETLDETLPLQRRRAKLLTLGRALGVDSEVMPESEWKDLVMGQNGRGSRTEPTE